MPAEYFDHLYATDPDPWHYASSSYEQHKYAATLRALPRTRFRRALEVGCSIGVFSRLLARKCNTLLAVDSSEAALVRARETCTSRKNIAFERMRIPAEWPCTSFGLVVISEVLYYLSPHDIAATAHKTLKRLDAGGTVALVHWLGPTGAAQTGDEAVRRFLSHTRRDLTIHLHRRTPRYRLDILVRSNDA
jgi:SAM-dependent methyltransferase